MTTAAITAARETREARALTRHVPVLQNVKARTAAGFALLVLSALYCGARGGAGRAATVAPMLIAAWLPAVWLTDKYVHKYPQRYYTYLFASHAKAGLVMAFLLIPLGLIAAAQQTWASIGAGFAVFVCADLLLSCPRRGMQPVPQETKTDAAPTSGGSAGATQELVPVASEALIAGIRAKVDARLAEFIAAHLPQGEGTAAGVLICDPAVPAASSAAAVGLAVSGVRMNDVRRMNRFLLDCAAALPYGGYFVCRYTPYESGIARLRKRYPGWLFRVAYLAHFARYRALPKIPYLNALYFALTNGKGRVFSKVELWGRLSYCGMHVVAEAGDDDERFVIAQKTAPPSRNKRPSYYPVVALEKVGLDGEIVRLHKVRSMYPFSEFLQKRIFEDNGLASTGKFANDFRLTEYGNFIRRYWIDELPQIWDWLRGDIKLVGMRATSRHYLSLYPQELYDLYIQIKPGLVPPIFDEKTDSFDRIVAVEMAYLTSYMKSPFKTDVGLFIKTFTDIFFRGVRSK